MTEKQRMDQIQQAIQRLEQQLDSGNVSVVVGTNGAVAFSGWNDRDNVSDVCAYRALATKGSFALQRAVQTAEMRAGRKLDAQVIAAGVHSHDGGQTWHAGH